MGYKLNFWGKVTYKAYRPAFLSTCVLLVLGIFYGCGDSEKHYMDEKVLIRAGGSIVTVRAFHEAFESSITSPSLLFQDPDALREKKYRILNRLSEELLILERARELNLRVSDEEAARVITDLKIDYPDDTFEKTLMENGISSLIWEKALRKRLLIEKVIRHDLSEHTFSTPLTLNENWDAGETETPPENKTPNDDSSEDPSLESNEEESGIPAHTIAAEAEYPDWINRLKQQYGIEIDWKLWEIIVQEQANGI